MLLGFGRASVRGLGLGLGLDNFGWMTLSLLSIKRVKCYKTTFKIRVTSDL